MTGWEEITGAVASTTLEVGGIWANRLSQLFKGVNIALADPSFAPFIGTKFSFLKDKLHFLTDDLTKSTQIIGPSSLDVNKVITIPALPPGLNTDELLLKSAIQSPTGKIIDIFSNVITDSTPGISVGDVLTWDGSEYLASPPTGGGSSFDPAASTIVLRSLIAGAQGIEFGPNHATGGSPFFDFHISSGDGDYSSRLQRNSGTNGAFWFLQKGTGAFEFRRAEGSIDMTTGIVSSIYTPVILAITGATPSTVFITNDQIIFYNATDLTDPYYLTFEAQRWTMNYGIVGTNAARGTVNMLASVIVAANSGSYQNELNNLSLYQRADNGTQASHWLTDFLMHGPVNVQPGMLSGITFLMNNYYNGSPIRRSSHMLGLQTNPGIDVFGAAEHDAATSYKVDYAIMIQGFGGSLASPTRGFEVGILIGDAGTGRPSCNWMGDSANQSKIGTGIVFRDIEDMGLSLQDPATSASSPVGIKVTTTTRTWDTFLDLSSGLAPTTAAIKLGARPVIGTTMKLMENGANVWDMTAISSTFSMLRIVPNVATVADTAARGILRVMNTSSGANPEYIEIKANGTNPYIIQVFAGGSGSTRQLDLYMGATIIFSVLTSNVFKALQPIQNESYVDKKIITIPADPAAGYIREYPKDIDSNNQAYYRKMKFAGAVVEWRVG